MIELLILLVVLAFLAVCLWLAVEVFIALLPYLVVGGIIWLAWRNRRRIAAWFGSDDQPGAG